jgi:hypothetical protein
MVLTLATLAMMVRRAHRHRSTRCTGSVRFLTGMHHDALIGIVCLVPTTAGALFLTGRADSPEPSAPVSARR